jgi:ATP adenylyltransferase
VQSADQEPGCVFCAALDADDEERLVVHRGSRAFVLLNKFPYSSGHLMVAPRRHVASSALSRTRRRSRSTGWPTRACALAAIYGPDGFNLGWNIGRVAGAGVVDHVHLHVVPRWSGDTNFMPVLADVKVLPEHLVATRSRLAEAWPTEERGDSVLGPN